MGTQRVSGSDLAGRFARRLAGLLAIAVASAAAPAAGAPPVFGPASPLDARAAANVVLDEPPVLAGSPAGTWIALWESQDSLGGAIGSDTDLLFARSPDGGASWSVTAALDPLATTDVAVDGQPAIATDGHGTWVVVWRSDRDGAGRGDLDLLFSRSTDDGLTWSPGAPLHAGFAIDAAGDGEPAIATDRQGRWVVAWTTDDGDTDVVAAHSLDAGATWSAPARLSAAGDVGDDLEPALATDGRGAWIAVWTSSDPLGGALGDDPDLLFARSDDGGGSWTAPALLNANAGVDLGGDGAAALASDGAGRWLVAWQSRDPLANAIGRDLDVLVARSDDGWSWTWPAPLNDYAAVDGSTDVEPTVACGGPGRCAVAWHSNHPLAGIGSDQDILLATTEDGGATWSATTPLDPRAATDAGADQRPALAADGRGTWIAAWQSNDSFGGTIGFDQDPVVAVGVEPPVCGDAVLHRDEACDDGNLLDGDGCDATCRVEPEPPPPADEPDLLAFFDASVADGTLRGVGTGTVGVRLMRQWIAIATVLQDAGQGRGACPLLALIARRADSDRPLVDGPARLELIARIDAMGEALGCGGSGGELPR